MLFFCCSLGYSHEFGKGYKFSQLARKSLSQANSLRASQRLCPADAKPKKTTFHKVVLSIRTDLVTIGAKQKQQNNHDNDNPQKLIVIAIKKAIEQTHSGVLLSFSLQPMQKARHVSAIGRAQK
jgi:hypothetical protein